MNDTSVVFCFSFAHFFSYLCGLDSIAIPFQPERKSVHNNEQDGNSVTVLLQHNTTKTKYILECTNSDRDKQVAYYIFIL